MLCVDASPSGKPRGRPEFLPNRLVIPPWFQDIPLQQQSVLLLALRGPDGTRRNHPCMDVLRAYRATILLSAQFGRHLAFFEGDPSNVQWEGDSFMGFFSIRTPEVWSQTVKRYLDHLDELPLHYHLHAMHGAQILGYKHPDDYLRGMWQVFYSTLVDDLHLNPETEAEMDARLSDWNRLEWDS